MITPTKEVFNELKNNFVFRETKNIYFANCFYENKYYIME